MLNPKLYEEAFPINKVEVFFDALDHSNFLGFKWQQVSKGRVPVGLDTSDSDFNTVGKMGGEKTHKLTIAEMPSHTHDCKTYGNGGVSTKGGGLWGVTDAYGEATNQYPSIYKTGGDQAHNNMQPYYTCFIWYRTA